MTKGFEETVFVYSFFLWVWLTFIARKTVKHPVTNEYGKALTDINTILTILTLGVDLIIVALSASFLARVIFASSNIYGFVKYGTISVFVFSLIGHVFISLKNILTIDKRQSVSNTIFNLLIYPVGIWTVQEVLKQK